MANPNIVNVVSIYGNTAVQSLGTSLTTIVTNASGSNSVYKVDSLIASNNDTVGHAVTVSINRTIANPSGGPTGTFPISTTVNVPPSAMYDVLAKFIYLNEGDSLQLSADAASKVTAVCSYEVIS